MKKVNFSSRQKVKVCRLWYPHTHPEHSLSTVILKYPTMPLCTDEYKLQVNYSNQYLNYHVCVLAIVEISYWDINMSYSIFFFYHTKDGLMRTLTVKPFSNTASSCVCLLVNSSSSFAISKATSFFFFLSPFGTECFNDWILAAKVTLKYEELVQIIKLKL